MAKKREPFEDDGRTIASMDFDAYKNPTKQNGPQKKKQPGAELTNDQMKEVLKGSFKASLLVGGIFTVALILFILFVTKVWLRQ